MKKFIRFDLDYICSHADENESVKIRNWMEKYKDLFFINDGIYQIKQVLTIMQLAGKSEWVISIMQRMLETYREYGESLLNSGISIKGE